MEMEQSLSRQPLLLKLNVRVQTVRNIDCVNGVFDCTLVINVRWVTPSSSPMPTPKDAAAAWQPVLLFSNAVEDVDIQDSRLDIINNIHTLFMTVSGKFAEHFDFEQFPLDYQRLHVQIKFANCPAERALMNMSPMFGQLSQSAIQTTGKRYSQSMIGNHLNMENKKYVVDPGTILMTHSDFMERDSWIVTDPYQMYCGFTNPKLDPYNTSFCKALLFVTLRRRPTFYFWYFVFPVSMQVSAGFITLFLPHDDLDNKTQITLNIMLTMFAVKFASTEHMPKISGLTYLEKYFVTSIITSMSIILQNLIVYMVDKYTNNDSYTTITNNVLGSIIFASFIATQGLAYMLLIFPSARKMFLKPIIDDSATKEAMIEQMICIDRQS